MSSLETLKIISKQWANVNDINSLASCGRDTASKIRNTIITEIKKSGKYLPASKEKIVPMSSVVNYLDLDIDFITTMAEKEKTLNA